MENYYVLYEIVFFFNFIYFYNVISIYGRSQETYICAPDGPGLAGAPGPPPRPPARPGLPSPCAANASRKQTGQAYAAWGVKQARPGQVRWPAWSSGSGCTVHGN